MKKRMLFFAALLCGILFALDRITKIWALSLQDDLVINQFLSFHLTFNRGISWGLLYSERSLVFCLVNAIIIALVLFLAHYTYTRYKAGHIIFGELLVLTGAVSNIIDRFYYYGVIDFIVLSYKDYYWPVFNIADALIVGGILIMVIGIITE